MGSMKIGDLLPGYYDVRDYGYVANPSVDNRAAIQAALDAAGAAGGGWVVLPPGTTGITATLFLDDYVTLDIPAGATLKALPSFDLTYGCLIINRGYTGSGNTGCAVLGRGVLDGNGLCDYGVRFGQVMRGALEPSEAGCVLGLYSIFDCAGMGFPAHPGVTPMQSAGLGASPTAGMLLEVVAGLAYVAEARGTNVVGAAAWGALNGGNDFGLVSSGSVDLVADAPLSRGDTLKAGTRGRSTKWLGSQMTIQSPITGEASAFTQPSTAGPVRIYQNADVPADRGRGIVIVGSNASGQAVTETISLHATDTTNSVGGFVSFTKVAGVYTANGAVLGAQNVRVYDNSFPSRALICTLAAGTSELAADIPSETREAYCDKLTITGPNGNTSSVTIVGYNDTNTAVLERATLNGASPSVVTTTKAWRYIDRVCLGEFTNAATGSVKTDATVDTSAMKCGLALADVTTRGSTFRALLKPNLTI